MKTNRFIFFILVGFSSLLVSEVADAKPMIEKFLTVNKTVWSISIEVVPSKPEGNGQGYCGAGEEVTLLIRKGKAKKIQFSKLIESCLNTTELVGGSFGSESAETLSQAISLEKNPIEFQFSSAGNPTVAAFIDLASGSPKYREEKPAGAR